MYFPVYCYKTRKRATEKYKQEQEISTGIGFLKCDFLVLATVGRNRAVADLPGFKLPGFVAWVLWSFVHLFTIVGVKNRLFVFLNRSWNYFTYDQSLRLLIKPKKRKNLQNTAWLNITNTKNH